jgi:hypothetical protein
MLIFLASHTQFFSVRRIQKVVSAVTEEFPDAANTHINGFSKAAGVDNFFVDFFIKIFKDFLKLINMGTLRFETLL